jgi:RecG-like helicase
MISLRGWWRDLNTSNTERDAAELRQVAAQTGAQEVKKIRRGEMVKVHGVVKSVSLRPEGVTPVFQADVFDGSDTVIVSWLGRRSIKGITPGRHIDIKGRVTEVEGNRTICNPEYVLHG